MGTLVGGALWAGRDATAKQRGGGSGDGSGAASADLPAQEVTPALAAAFFVAASAVLLLLYLFINYIGYIMVRGLGLACAGPSAGIQRWLYPFSSCPFGCHARMRMWDHRDACLRHHARQGSVRLAQSHLLTAGCPAQVVLFCSAAVQGMTLALGCLLADAFPQMRKHKIRDVPLAYVVSCCTAVATAALWAVCRNRDWAWMLQDALGATLIMFFIRTIQLPSLKASFQFSGRVT